MIKWYNLVQYPDSNLIVENHFTKYTIDKVLQSCTIYRFKPTIQNHFTKYTIDKIVQSCTIYRFKPTIQKPFYYVYNQ